LCRSEAYGGEEADYDESESYEGYM